MDEPVGRTPETSTAVTVDPVCGMTIDPGTAAARRHYRGRDFYFCGHGCADAFDADPEDHNTTGRP